MAEGPGQPGRTTSERAAAGTSRLGRALDATSDWALLAFATWTLIAYSGMLAKADVDLLALVWIAAALAVGAGMLALPWDSSHGLLGAGPSPAWPAGGIARSRWSLVVASLLCAALSALLFAVTPDAPWPLIWLPAVAAVAIAIFAATRARRAVPGDSDRGPGFAAHAFVVLAGLGFAALSLFVNRPNTDDVFYVNRATATAQLDRIPIRDVLLSNEQLPPTSGAGLPVDTFSALQGAVAGLVGIQAPSIAYYVTPVVFTFLATWALWRLVRAWAPRALVVCFALGCVFWVFSAQLSLTPGSYFASRMWQGKVIFVAWLVPTLYVYLTRWLAGRDAFTAVLLLAGGIAAIGMTSSATFVVPLLYATAALPLLARRDWRGLPVVLAAPIFPVVVGAVATLKYPLAQEFAFSRAWSGYVFESAVGSGVVSAIAGFALWAAPWLTRSRAAAAMTSGIAVMALAVLFPGVVGFLSDATDLTGSMRRMLWIVPLPALVALLPAAPLVARGRRLAVGIAAVAVAVLIAFGHPLWINRRDAEALERSPRWKVNRPALATARAILTRYDGDGPVLARDDVMGAIARITVEPKAVNPRRWYTQLIPEPGARTEERLWLTEFVTGRRRPPPLAELRRALADLDVGLVCLPRKDVERIAMFQAAGPYRRAFSPGGQVCLERGGEEAVG